MKENRTRMAMTIDIAGITKDTAPDVLLQNEDSLVIASTEEINKKKMIYVYGEVFVPGEQPYAEGLTIEDAIVSAGGLKETATTLNVEVSRMLIYTHTKDSTYNTQAKVYQFTLKDGLPINEGSKFTLQPGDMVSIHRSPEYQQQQRITVNGEVLYAGTYTLTGKNERLSSVIKRAGGLTAAAAGANARLIRKMTPEERERKIQLVEIERRSLMQDKEKTQSLSLDSTDIKKLKIKEYYNVGIDLDKAMKNPGCSEDVVLRDSDQIIIPQHDYTVRINGEVLYSNTVSYVKGKRGSYYLNQAGGVSKTGDKKKAYVIYANGQVSRLSKGKVMPGCEIVVPTKQKKETNMQNTSLLISAASVLATVAAVLISALK
jgi:protein involved in polysaccharide export with SLBB domain